MIRPAFKPDSSFFRKIAIGAIGARAVSANLSSLGHELVELERGSTDVKLWKNVKRKRVRIPDLVCKHCGLRVESRAKTKAELSMSHSPNDAERAWDYGMVDNDVVAFPVCRPGEELHWSSGKLEGDASYWHERNWVDWRVEGAINYFTVQAFRSVQHVATRTKGSTEGSETSISWAASFSKRDSTVALVDDRRVVVKRSLDDRNQTLQIRPGLDAQVRANQVIKEHQVISSAVHSLQTADLLCSREMPEGRIQALLQSRERTQRFTGVKLARIRCDREHRASIQDLMDDHEEDIYIRLESATYLVSVWAESATSLFAPYLNSSDNQIQLEAVIALGEANAPEAIDVLAGILNDGSLPYFLRSAAAWSLGRIDSESSATQLIRAFEDVSIPLREEALNGLVSIGGRAIPLLLSSLNGSNDIAAGCAETLRQQELTDEALKFLVNSAQSNTDPTWAVWLIGQIPSSKISAMIASLQESAPDLHYAISILWSFMDSWISRHWEPHPKAQTNNRHSSTRQPN